VIGEQTYTTLVDQVGILTSHPLAYEILGIHVDPWGSPADFKIYISHNWLYANNGGCPELSAASPYAGYVSYLQAPNFDQLHILIRNLPVSNHDHAVNGLQFDLNGDLLFCSGGNTNAGLFAPACYGQDNTCSNMCNMGNIPESPLTTCIIKAELTKGDAFNGTVEYEYRPGFVSFAFLLYPFFFFSFCFCSLFQRVCVV
jgi:hypothetical protein